MFAIFGDIHGCIDELKQLHKLISDMSHDPREFVSVGDMVDRGPDSLACVDFVRNNFQHAVQGNHEKKLLRRLESDKVNYQYPEVLEQFADPNNQHITSWLRSLPTFIDFGDLIVAHAGHPYWPEERVKKIANVNYFGFNDGVINERGFPGRLPWADKWNKNMNKFIVHGHNAVYKPEFNGKVVNVDTGCVYGGYLTAFLWPEKVFVSVQSQQPFNDGWDGTSVYEADEGTDLSAIWSCPSLDFPA